MAKVTIEEKFLLKIYLLAKSNGDLSGEVELDRPVKELSISPTKAKTILKLLCSSGFLKRSGENTVALTAKGIKVAEDLRVLANRA